MQPFRPAPHPPGGEGRPRERRQDVVQTFPEESGPRVHGGGNRWLQALPRLAAARTARTGDPGLREAVTINPGADTLSLGSCQEALLKITEAAPFGGSPMLGPGSASSSTRASRRPDVGLLMPEALGVTRCRTGVSGTASAGTIQFSIARCSAGVRQPLALPHR